jgi:hypothetical protein
MQKFVWFGWRVRSRAGTPILLVPKRSGDIVAAPSFQRARQHFAPTRCATSAPAQHPGSLALGLGLRAGKPECDAAFENLCNYLINQQLTMHRDSSILAPLSSSSSRRIGRLAP